MTQHTGRSPTSEAIIGDGELFKGGDHTTLLILSHMSLQKAETVQLAYYTSPAPLRTDLLAAKSMAFLYGIV